MDDDNLPALPIQKAANLKLLVEANIQAMEADAAKAELLFTHDLEPSFQDDRFDKPKLVAIRRRAQAATLRALLAAL